jgi:hypothetical protein
VNLEKQGCGRRRLDETWREMRGRPDTRRYPGRGRVEREKECVGVGVWEREKLKS